MQNLKLQLKSQKFRDILKVLSFDLHF